MEIIAKENEIPSLDSIEYLVHRLIIFYSDKKDSQRLVRLNFSEILK
jgi:hypothetical protein